MKTITTIAIVATLGTAFSCCGAKKSTEKAGEIPKTEELSGIYRINIVDGDDWSGKALTLTFDPETGSVSGTTECNRIFGSYTVTGDKVEFGPIASTKMYCEGRMDTEQTLVQTLNDTGFFYIENGELNLCRTEDKGNAVLVAAKVRSEK